VVAIKGTLVSPQTPSWIDDRTDKVARQDHLLGLGVEFTANEGVGAWVGSPYQDHARVSVAVKIGKSRLKSNRTTKKKWYQKMSLKHWQGISHQIDEQLRMRAKQSLDDIRNGTIGVDEARKQVLANRIAAAKEVILATPEDKQARMPFRNKEQQLLLKRKSKLAAALQEAIAKKGFTQIQQMCMYDLGLTVPLRMSQQGKEAMVDTVRWKTLMKAEVQNCTSKIDNMAKHQTRKCELQAKRQEARENLRDKKGPSKFCGKMQSSMDDCILPQLTYSMPRGVLWMHYGVTISGADLIRKVQSAIPTTEVQHAKAAAMISLTIPAGNVEKGDALIARAQQTWRWNTALQKPEHVLEVVRHLVLQKQSHILGEVNVS
jgi:hypothetical protein